MAPPNATNAINAKVVVIPAKAGIQKPGVIPAAPCHSRAFPVIPAKAGIQNKESMSS